MKVSQRDKKLVLVLPALAVAIGYCLMFDRSLNARIGVLRKQVISARATPASSGELMRQEATLAEATRTLAAVEEETQKIRGALADSGASVSNRASEQVAALLTRHRLALIEQAMLTSVPQGINPSLQRLAAQGGVTNGAERAVFWRVKFVGTYPDTVSALDELTTSAPLVIPANLSMADGPNKRTKTWTFVLWM